MLFKDTSTHHLERWRVVNPPKFSRIRVMRHGWGDFTIVYNSNNPELNVRTRKTFVYINTVKLEYKSVLQLHNWHKSKIKNTGVVSRYKYC